MTRLILFLLSTVISSFAATVAHYKFEAVLPNSPIYELTDSSGRGHHGRVIGQELFELTSDVPSYPGVTGAALDARGRLDYAVIPHHPDFAPTGDWTIEFFIKPALFHQDHGGATNIAGPFRPHINTNLSYTILAKRNSQAMFGSAWAFHYQPANGNITFTISRGPDQSETIWIAKDFRDDKWHHIAVVFAASQENEIRLFVDGFSSQSSNIGSIPFAWGDEPIYVGAWARQDQSFSVQDRNFDGLLDEIRFSNAALDARSFVIDFTPYLFPPIPAEAHPAIEIQFQAEAGKIYRIEQVDSATASWKTLGYALGEGGSKSFFHRRDFFRPPSFRVLPDLPEPALPLTFSTFDAIEIRFPTDPGQLYTIQRCETLNCGGFDQVFVLGDGAKMSHFERTSSNPARFYKIERY